MICSPLLRDMREEALAMGAMLVPVSSHVSAASAGDEVHCLAYHFTGTEFDSILE
jgi:hypothetical protein